jgi:hypothetical protein
MTTITCPSVRVCPHTFSPPPPPSLALDWVAANAKKWPNEYESLDYDDNENEVRVVPALLSTCWCVWVHVRDGGVWDFVAYPPASLSDNTSSPFPHHHHHSASPHLQAFRKQHFHAPQRKVKENMKNAKTLDRMKWAIHGAIGVVVGECHPSTLPSSIVGHARVCR